MAILDLQMLELPAEAKEGHGRNSGASKNCVSALSLLIC
jgi:hypothetical protein